jgi:hypothetical protein
MALAYYLVLAYIGSTLSEAALKAASAPPTDPRLLLAVMMIGLELALVTALALFWSTFSSSALLSAGLTFGLYVAGQFGADLKNFEQVVKSPAAWIDRPRPLLPAPELRCVRYQDRGGARAADSAGVSVADRRIRVDLHRTAADDVGHDFCAEGISSSVKGVTQLVVGFSPSRC